MAQVRKPEIEARIVDAAREEFVARGVAATSIAAIAGRAGLSVGNVYRYFASKEALVAQAVPATVVARLRALLTARVRALAGVGDVAALGPGARYRVLSEALMQFCAEHRLAVVIALAGDAATPYAGLAAQVRRQLARLAVAHAATLTPAVRVGRTTRFVLDQIYGGFVAAMAAILRHYTTAEAIGAAVDRYAAYHLTGLARLLATEPTLEAP